MSDPAVGCVPESGGPDWRYSVQSIGANPGHGSPKGERELGKQSEPIFRMIPFDDGGMKTAIGSVVICSWMPNKL
jgi:hypothetical protein